MNNKISKIITFENSINSLYKIKNCFDKINCSDQKNRKYLIDMSKSQTIYSQQMTILSKLINLFNEKEITYNIINENSFVRAKLDVVNIKVSNQIID